MEAAEEQLKHLGRPAGATHDDVLAEATRQYLNCDRIDVQAIAVRLGIGRTTIYRWFGSREDVVGAVLVGLAEQGMVRAREGTKGKGAEGLLTAFDRYNRAVVKAPAMRAFVDQERDIALKIVTAGYAAVQPAMVAFTKSLIEEEQAAGAYDPPIPVDTLAYALVRIGEAFLYNDAAAGMPGETHRLREVQAVLLGLPPDA
jgi:AcrR family transcriptional regulator